MDLYGIYHLLLTTEPGNSIESIYGYSNLLYFSLNGHSSKVKQKHFALTVGFLFKFQTDVPKHLVTGNLYLRTAKNEGKPFRIESKSIWDISVPIQKMVDFYHGFHV